MLPLLWSIIFQILLVSLGLFILDWRIALITLALLTTPLYLPKLIEKRLQEAQTAYLQAVEANLVKINDWLDSFEMIKNFSIEKRIKSKFRSSNAEAMQKLYADMKLETLAQLLTTLISYLSYFIILAVSAWLVLRGDFTAGNFFVAIGMIDQLSYPLLSLSGIMRQLLSIRPTSKELENFIKESEEIKPTVALTSFDRKISFSDVNFNYVEGQPILREFNFLIQKGRRYLLKGNSGSGKTTVINLLLKYYEPTAGDILVDGKSLRNYDSTYDCMTVVRQDVTVFHDSLRNNISMYRDVPEERLFDLLNSLGLEKFSNQASLDSIQTEGGGKLSGGERKRLGLARALLRDTDMLLLDEPLANLDQDTASKIEDLILSVKDRTIIVVSHQFSEEKLSAFDQVITL